MMSNLNSSTFIGLGTVRALIDHELDPLFWRAELLHSHSAWCSHIPFAHWIVGVVSPRMFVELGTHTGVSYSAFCLAVERERLDTKCFAIDTWQGDEQAGYYGDDVFSTLEEYHKDRFSAFSTLIRSRFDDATEFFADGSIDLLHIDGLHTYEAVSHDFETWRSKLSDRAVVLLHDTNVLRDDFGVWQFWARIRKNYPSFEFIHGNGLGVLVVGDNAPQSIVELCKLTDPAVLSAVRDRFAMIGERWEVEQAAKWRAEQKALNTNTRLAELRGALSNAQQESAGALAAHEAEQRSRAEALALSASLLEEARAEASLAREAAQTTASLLEEAKAEASVAREAVREGASRCEEVRTELDEVRAKLEGAYTELGDASRELEGAKAELEKARADISSGQETIHLNAVELAHAEREIGRLRRELAAVKDWATNEHLLMLRDVALAYEATVKAREIGGRHARARFLAEARFRAAQQRLEAIQHSPGRSVAAVIEKLDKRVPVARGPRFAYRLMTRQLRQRRMEYAEHQAQLLAEAERNAAKAEAISATGLFDPQYYLDSYSDVAESGLTPEMHYAALGWLEGRRPSAAFDPDFYLSEYSDVAEAGLNPLLHYAEHGRKEGRLPLPLLPVPRELVLPRPPAEEAERLLPTIRSLIYDQFATLRPLPIFHDMRAPKSLTIVTDSLGSQSLFGGVGTALVVGTLMASRLACQLRVVTRHDAPDAEAYRNILSANGLVADINPEFLYLPLDGSRQLPVGPSDLVLTTSWWTTRSVMQSLPPTSIIYLLQEDERMFYPSGDHLLRCVETLKNENLRVIVNTEALFNHLAEGASPLPGLKQRGTWFKPAFPSIKKPDWHGTSLRRNFFFYARPNHARNLFWRGLEAVEASIEEGILDTSKWNFYFVGSDVPPMQLAGGIAPVVVSQMPWAEYAAFVSTIDLGLSLMDTPHPSYPPIDLAAAGAVVVTSAHGSKISLDEWSPNIICATPTLDGLREGLRSGVALATDMVARKANYEKNNIGRDWYKSLEPSFQQLFVNQ